MVQSFQDNKPVIRTITVDVALLDSLIEQAKAEITSLTTDLAHLLINEGGTSTLQAYGLAQGRKDGATDRRDALIKLRESAVAVRAQRAQDEHTDREVFDDAGTYR